MNDAVITLNGLEKRFPGMDKPAVAPLDCTIHAGYVTGLVGPDGAGKTTLMRMLAGLLKPDSGSATVIGFDPIKNDAALHAVLGYMPQKFGLVQARPSFCFIPPESLPARRPVNGPRDVNSSRRAKVCLRASPVTLRKSAYRLRFSITVRSSYRPNFCGI